MYVQRSKLNTINVIERRSPCYFETVIYKETFSFINLTFVTRKWENKNTPIELVTPSKFFIF